MTFLSTLWFTHSPGEVSGDSVPVRGQKVTKKLRKGKITNSNNDKDDKIIFGMVSHHIFTLGSGLHIFYLTKRSPEAQESLYNKQCVPSYSYESVLNPNCLTLEPGLCLCLCLYDCKKIEHFFAPFLWWTFQH